MPPEETQPWRPFRVQRCVPRRLSSRRHSATERCHQATAEARLRMARRTRPCPGTKRVSVPVCHHGAAARTWRHGYPSPKSPTDLPEEPLFKPRSAPANEARGQALSLLLRVGQPRVDRCKNRGSTWEWSAVRRGWRRMDVEALRAGRAIPLAGSCEWSSSLPRRAHEPDRRTLRCAPAAAPGDARQDLADASTRSRTDAGLSERLRSCGTLRSRFPMRLSHELVVVVPANEIGLCDSRCHGQVAVRAFCRTVERNIDRALDRPADELGARPVLRWRYAL